MNRNTLILLQSIGVLSIIPYPFVFLANIMSIAAPGHNSVNSIPWILLMFYPLVWAVLYVLAWRAMARGEIGLAFGLSSVPAFACMLVVGFFLFGWVRFGLGMAGIGDGGLHSRTFPTNNPVLDSMLLASQDIQIGNEPERAVGRTIHEIELNPKLINVSVPPYGSPLNLALRDLSINLDGTITGDNQRADRLRLVHTLLSHGARLNPDEASIRQTWNLKRVLYEGAITTSSENALVWRIVTHQRGPSKPPKPFNPLTDPLPPRNDTPPSFALNPSELPLLNRSTRHHGTPLYAGLLDDAIDVCSVIVKAGGRLSVEEERDPAAAVALQHLFEREPALRSAYQASAVP